jgi:hypothetical protein
MRAVVDPARQMAEAFLHLLESFHDRWTIGQVIEK